MNDKAKDLELQKINSNYVLFRNLVASLKNPQIQKLIDDLGEDLALAPASTKTIYHGAYPGGLVQTAIKTAKTALELKKAMKLSLPESSVLLAALMFDIGKVKVDNKPYFLPKNSDWHQKQGINYEYNPAVAAISPALHSLFTLQAYSIQLTKEEFYAILSTKDRTQLTGEASFYGKSDLTTLLQAAISFTITSLEGKTSVLD
jgi:hypothetical protein